MFNSNQFHEKNGAPFIQTYCSESLTISANIEPLILDFQSAKVMEINLKTSTVKVTTLET